MRSRLDPSVRALPRGQRDAVAGESYSHPRRIRRARRVEGGTARRERGALARKNRAPSWEAAPASLLRGRQLAISPDDEQRVSTRTRRTLHRFPRALFPYNSLAMSPPPAASSFQSLDLDGVGVQAQYPKYEKLPAPQGFDAFLQRAHDVAALLALDVAEVSRPRLSTPSTQPHHVTNTARQE